MNYWNSKENIAFELKRGRWALKGRVIYHYFENEKELQEFLFFKLNYGIASKTMGK